MRRTGFTLVELLVVIAIIALLIGILLPALGAAKSTALYVGCQTNLRSIGQAVHAYATDNNNFKVPASWPVRPEMGHYGLSGISPNIKRSFAPTGAGILIDQDYLVFDSITDFSREMHEDTLIDEDKFRDPTVSGSGSSYLYFYMWAADRAAITESWPPMGPIMARQTLDNAAAAGEYALFTDMNSDANHGFVGAHSAVYDDNGNLIAGPQPWVSHPREGRSNVLFLDGSVGQGDNRTMRMELTPGPGNKNNRMRDDWFRMAHALYSD